jgi:hypothetical protein
MLAHRILDSYMTGGSIDSSQRIVPRKGCKNLSGGVLAQA